MDKRFVITVEDDAVTVEMFDKNESESWELRDYNLDDFSDFIKYSRQVRDILGAVKSIR